MIPDRGRVGQEYTDVKDAEKKQSILMRDRSSIINCILPPFGNALIGHYHDNLSVISAHPARPSAQSQASNSLP